MHANYKLILIAIILVTSQTVLASSESVSWNVNGVNKSVGSERSFGVLSSYEFEKFQHSLSYVASSKCKHELSDLLDGIVKGLPWAIASKF